MESIVRSIEDYVGNTKPHLAWLKSKSGGDASTGSSGGKSSAPTAPPDNDTDSASTVTVSPKNIFNGLRGKTLLWWEMSSVDANDGLLLRGQHKVQSLPALLPSAHKEGASPLVEGLLLLLLTGQVPSVEQARAVRAQGLLRLEGSEGSEGSCRGGGRGGLCVRVEGGDTPDTPLHRAQQAVNALSPDVPILVQLATGVLALSGSRDSAHRRHHCAGEARSTQWQHTLADALHLLALLPHLAGHISRRRAGEGETGIRRDVGMSLSDDDDDDDYAAVVAKLVLGTAHPCAAAFVRTYIAMHCDHGGGNSSAHTARVVSATGATPAAAVAASWLALEGPLHGGAAADALKWATQMRRELELRQGQGQPSVAGSAPSVRSPLSMAAAAATGLGGDSDSREIERYAARFLRGGKGRVIPGFGHAVLRRTDPRALALLAFADSYDYGYGYSGSDSTRGSGRGSGSGSTRSPSLRSHPDVALARAMLSAVPAALMTHGKSKVTSPHANVDAVSGLVLRAVLHVSTGGPTGGPTSPTAKATAATLQVSGSPHYHYYREPASGSGGPSTGTGTGGRGVSDGELVSLLFALSRAFGVLAQVVLDRAMELPLERPDSATAAMLGVGGRAKL